jgi:hypothetical protein
VGQDERSKCLLGCDAVFVFHLIREVLPSGSRPYAATESSAIGKAEIDREVAVLVKRMNFYSPLSRRARTDNLNRWPFSERLDHRQLSTRRNRLFVDHDS